MNLFQRWKQTTIANKGLVFSSFLMAFGTLFYAGAASVQVYIMSRSAHDASVQTDKLIKAAQTQASAATKFAAAAQTQADRMKELVDKAGTQTGATNRLAEEGRGQANTAREAMTANIDSAQQDRRPWVGIRVECSTCQQFEADGSLNASIAGVIANSGKTPAVGMKFTTSIAGPLKDGGIPSIDSLQQEADARLRENMSRMRPEVAAEVARAVKETTQTQPIIALAPNAGQNFGFGPITYTGRQFQPGHLPKSQQPIYAIGKVTYYGTDRKREYVTTFCLVNEFGHREFGFCSTGNDMN